MLGLFHQLQFFLSDSLSASEVSVHPQDSPSFARGRVIYKGILFKSYITIDFSTTVEDGSSFSMPSTLINFYKWLGYIALKLILYEVQSLYIL